MSKMRFVLLLMVAAFTAPLFALYLPARDVDQSQHSPSHTDDAPGLVDLVRHVTEPFQDVTAATGAEYAEFLGCVSSPQQGAMGVHFVNDTFVHDGEIDVNRPEALIYEPKHGGYKLVGVEYVVFADDWHIIKKHKEPPVLEGQVFQYVGSPNRYRLPPFYELHVWAVRENPHGAFVDWNPRVSCEVH
jgi:hypothetical protein